MNHMVGLEINTPKDQGSDHQVIRCWTRGMVSGSCEAQEPRGGKPYIMSQDSYLAATIPYLQAKGRASGRTHQMREIIHR